MSEFSDLAAGHLRDILAEASLTRRVLRADNTIDHANLPPALMHEASLRAMGDLLVAIRDQLKECP